MKSVAKAYVTKREVSVQEAVYLSLPQLWLRKIFPRVVLRIQMYQISGLEFVSNRKKSMNYLKIALMYLKKHA